MQYDVVSARVAPNSHLNVLSRQEVIKLHDTSCGELSALLRKCTLAVLNYGSLIDDSKELLQRFPDFEIGVIQQERGIELEVTNAPASAFVDGEMIAGIREMLFSVVRDIVFVDAEIQNNKKFNLDSSSGITSAVFCILRNARIFRPNTIPQYVVCWGGHSIPRVEYDYTKEVGYQIGLRGLDICTGCGPGAMKGPMKGATIGHAKQRNFSGQYLGITEPGIIAAESPNPIVNNLVILPDIEKRLEAFIRIGHAIIVFPGGVGTAEEILYLLSILLEPENDSIPFPVILSGPKVSEEYFKQIDAFIGLTLGEVAQRKYEIIIDEPITVARKVQRGTEEVQWYRKQNGDAYYFNWLLNIRHAFQKPFEPTHENMAKLEIKKDRPSHLLAGDLRKVFSGIVAGNVKESGIQAIEEYGAFEINGDEAIMESLDALLASFVDQGRMKLPSSKKYTPCYKVIKGSK